MAVRIYPLTGRTNASYGRVFRGIAPQLREILSDEQREAAKRAEVRMDKADNNEDKLKKKQ